MRTALILNPGAGASLLADQKIHEENLEKALLKALREQGLEPEVHYTTVDDPGQGIAAHLAAKQVGLVIAVGGDGTIHAVAHGLLGSSSVLGIIPAGTMNNLALSLGIPANLTEACAILANGAVRAIDVGRINQQVFLEVAGVGLETALFPAAEAVKSRGLLSTCRGILDGLRILYNFKLPKMRLTFDGEEARTYRAMQLTICNAPYYGPHLSVAPSIYLNDGWLDVVLYTTFRKSEYIRHAISISQGRRVLTPKIIHRRVKMLRLSTNAAVDFQADGIIYGSTPVEITIMPAALNVQVPTGPVPGLQAEREQRQKRKIWQRRKVSV
jgi:diacylglycerol kinase (ATP)